MHCNSPLTPLRAETSLKSHFQVTFSKETLKYVKGISQLQYIDMGKGVLTIQNSLKFFKIGMKSCRKHKNYVALDCGLGDRDPKYPRGVPWAQFFCSIFSSYHPHMIIFYGFCGLVMLKMPKITKKCFFRTIP